MANVYAVKNGNWSDPTVWNTGGLPATTDDVYANNYTVTIDASASVRSITNKAATGITAGGGYILGGGVTFTSTLEIGGSVGGSVAPIITYAAASPAVSTINANIYCVPAINNFYALSVTGTGTLNIVGSIKGNSGAAQNGWGAYISGAATVNITGDVNAGVSGYPGNYGLYIGAAATVNVTGNVSGPPENSGADWYLQGIVVDHASAVVRITGVVSGACNAGYGVALNKNATLYITGALVAGYQVSATLAYPCQAVAGSAAFISHTGPLIACGNVSGGSVLTAGAFALTNNGVTVLTGPFINARNGQPAFYSTGHVFLVPTLNNYWQFNQYAADGSGAPAYLYSSDKLGDVPAVGDVRYGTTYANSTLTGTCRIPPANQVRYGKAVDATVGTAALTAADVWNYAVSNGFTAGSIGERLKIAATTDTTGAQLAALG